MCEKNLEKSGYVYVYVYNIHFAAAEANTALQINYMSIKFLNICVKILKT